MKKEGRGVGRRGGGVSMMTRCKRKGKAKGEWKGKWKGKGKGKGGGGRGNCCE